jgi:hypothetical protein
MRKHLTVSCPFTEKLSPSITKLEIFVIVICEVNEISDVNVMELSLEIAEFSSLSVLTNASTRNLPDGLLTSELCTVLFIYSFFSGIISFEIIKKV